MNAFVTSRLDSCNSLLIGLPRKDIQRLQHIQNSAARLVTLSKRYDHITPVLHDLHWLPIAQRIEFKVLLTTFKILMDLAPTYLAELVNTYVPSRTLRSSSQNLLQVPAPRTKTYGQRAFSTMAPMLWNALPINIRKATSVPQFKNLLKKHLFRVAYDL